MADITEARQHHLAVERTARYWALGDPEAEEVWIVLHGYNQLAKRFLRRFTAIAGLHRLVVAPEALSRFYVVAEAGRHTGASLVGGSWMTREDRLTEIDDYVRYLDRLAAQLEVEGRRVTVLGFSQGAATASRWVCYGRTAVEHLVLWGDFSPPDLDFDRASPVLSRTRLTMVRGSRDRALTPELASEEEERLSRHGIGYETIRYDGGHEIVEETLLELVGD